MVIRNIVEFINSCLSKLRIVCDHNRALSKFLSPIRKVWKGLGISRIFMKIMSEDDSQEQKQCEEFKEFYKLHKKEFRKLSEILEDDFSRYTLEKILEYRQTKKMSVLKDIVVYPQYFLKDIFKPVQNEVFVDGGAYVGDTVLSFIESFTGGGRIKKIYAWEPDKANFLALKRNTSKLDNIIYVPYGLWKEKTELNFKSTGTDGSEIAETITSDVINIKVNSIDNVCAGDKVTFIKMDIEGSEQAALQGAINVIKRDKPRLAICIYHKPQDLFEIPFLIKDMVPEYKLYMRHHSHLADDTVIYATL